jgi:hypothetical protein
MSQCYQEIIQDIEHLQSIVDDQIYQEIIQDIEHLQSIIDDQSYQEIIEDIEHLQSIVDDQSVDYPTNQTDLLFLDLTGYDCREYSSVYTLARTNRKPIKPIISETCEPKKVDSSEFELFCTEKPRSPEKIRESFNNINWYPEGITLGKALEKGAEAVRKYYNDKNLRKRGKK